ncbi:hypothetical protein KAT60_00700, partial [Candidatus Woesebacteria bacterium]|nr:hypothetical protein [Candidatus Woesebacteria bacterium]
TSSYNSKNFDNEYDPGHWAGGTFAYYFEGTVYRALSDGEGRIDYTSLQSYTISPAIGGYGRQRNTNDMVSDMPGTATDLDTQLRGYTASPGIIYCSTSWLIIQVSSLQIPENLLLFLPLVVFIPAIFKKGFNSEGLNLGILDSVIPRRKHRRKRIYYSNFIEEIDDG